MRRSGPGGWMRRWGTVHPALGAGVDEATAFLARGMLVNTLTAIKLPSVAGSQGHEAINPGSAWSRHLLEKGCVSACLPRRAGWSRWA